MRVCFLSDVPSVLYPLTDALLLFCHSLLSSSHCLSLHLCALVYPSMHVYFLSNVLCVCVLSCFCPQLALLALHSTLFASFVARLTLCYRTCTLVHLRVSTFRHMFCVRPLLLLRYHYSLYRTCAPVYLCGSAFCRMYYGHSVL